MGIDMAESHDFLDELYKCFGDTTLKPEQYYALGLAYIGDGVYDLVIRTLVLELGNGKVREFHRITSGIVKAESQAKTYRAIESELTEEEQAVFHRGRNAKSATSAKNASIVSYRIATGLEALMGYLYLSHRMDRIMELTKMGLERMDLMPKSLVRTKK